MSFYTTYFGSFAAYKEWNDGRDGRAYMVILTNTDTSEVYKVKDNPTGITTFGLILDRHKELHGISETASLKLSFAKKEGSGGDFILDAYTTSAIRANVLCTIYKKNPETADFDIRYDYEVMFEAGSYNDSELFIDVTLKQVGILQTVMSRLETNVDITKNTAIDGQTVTDTTSVNLPIPEVNVYLYGDSENGDISIEDQVYSGTGTDNVYFTGGTEGTDLTFGRINFHDPTDGKIYINDTDEAKDIKFSTAFTYNLEGTKYNNDSLRLEIRYYTYQANGTLITEYLLKQFLVPSDGAFNQTEYIDFVSDYISIPIDGYAVFKAIVVYVATGSTIINTARITDTIENRIDERSNSIGVTNALCYSYPEAMLKAFRLVVGVDDCFDNNFTLPGILWCYLTSGWKLRNYRDKGITLNIKELFLSGDFLEAIGIGYNASTNKFFAANYEYFYKDELMVDFGVVDNFEIYPSEHYYGEIMSGSTQDGKYEADQGVREFNIQATHGTTFKVTTKIDLRCPYVIDSLNIEYTRREQQATSGVKDTEHDDSIFLFNSNGTEVFVDNYQPEGFTEVSEYMNLRYNYNETLRRLGGRLAGMFRRDSGEFISFRSNKKDLDITYVNSLDGRINLNDNISQDSLSDAMFFPEVQTFEPIVTVEQVDAIRANPYGYYKCEDILGNIHFGYLDNFTLEDYKNKAKVKGLTANINR